MATAIFDQLSDLEKREIRMFGATRDQVDEAVDSYLRTRSPRQIVTDMLMSARREASWGLAEDARQTLNRAKVTIQRFFTGNDRGFFSEPEGQAYSILSDAQELMAMHDLAQARACIDEAHELISAGGNIRG